MPFNLPNPPSGNSPAATWLRRVWSALRAQRILPGVGYKVKHTSNGTILEVNPGGGGGGGGGSLRAGTIATLYGGPAPALANYFSVQPVDADGEPTGDPVMVAKSPPAWMETTNGTDTYTYIDDNTRTVDGSSPLIYQYITDLFVEDQLVFFLACEYTGVETLDVTPVPVKYMCVRTEREWTEPEAVS